jgi:hypothetical protein
MTRLLYGSDVGLCRFTSFHFDSSGIDSYGEAVI